MPEPAPDNAEGPDNVRELPAAKPAERPWVKSKYANARDLVQIIAIVAAGLWAIYQFVYETKIKPLLEPPRVTFNATMTKVGETDGLDAVRLDVAVRNPGRVRVDFVGFSYTVLGSMVSAAAEPQAAAGEPAIGSSLRTFWTTGESVPVYREAYLLHLADPKAHGRMNLEPGDNIDLSRTFYVPHGKFNYLQSYISARWVRDAGERDDLRPATMSIDAEGLPKFEAKGIDSWGVEFQYGALSL